MDALPDPRYALALGNVAKVNERRRGNDAMKVDSVWRAATAFFHAPSCSPAEPSSH